MQFLDTGFLHNREIRLTLDGTVDENPVLGRAAAYYFTLCRLDGVRMGECELRIGHSADTFYSGNIGYLVYPRFRGHHYAEKASRLLFSLAQKHGMDYVLITCNPDNIPSRRTCERLGGKFIELVRLPEDHDLAMRGETYKCVFRFDLLTSGSAPGRQKLQRLFHSF